MDAEAELELIAAAVAQSDSSVSADRIRDLPRCDAIEGQGEAGWIDAATSPSVLSTLLKAHLVFGPTVSETYLAVPRSSGPAW